MSQPFPLFVTRPDLPPLAEFMPALEAIWDSRQLTNNGIFHRQFERELADYLGVAAVSLFGNGTLALMAAIKVLGLSGEVITTPFSFVATSHALLWNGLTPVFVDIEPETFTIDPARIEAAITPRTSAILPVHVYGHPCATQALEEIARRHGLKILYDAAHAFGVRLGSENLLQAGDLSVLSFHATKVFHTFEGGAVVCQDQAIKQRLDDLRNFGIADETTVREVGINGKMNELQAALGSLQLPRFAENNQLRKNVDAYYRQALAGIHGIHLPPIPTAAVHNHGYFPIRVTGSYPLSRDALYEKMRNEGIMTRRYFYPLISRFPMYRSHPSAAPENLPVAQRIANHILCLPIYSTMSEADCDRVVDSIGRH